MADIMADIMASFYEISIFSLLIWYLDDKIRGLILCN